MSKYGIAGKMDTLVREANASELLEAMSKAMLRYAKDSEQHPQDEISACLRRDGKQLQVFADQMPALARHQQRGSE